MRLAETVFAIFEGILYFNGFWLSPYMNVNYVTDYYS